MSDFVVPQLPFLDLPRAVETIRAAGGWLHCEERDLITLWKSGSIELCFSVPDWIACADMDFPGKGSDVLLSVEYGSFMRWWAEEPYSWPPPPNEVTMQFRSYGTTDPYREMKLSAWADMRLSPDYQPVDDSGEGLANALRAMYSSNALVIPRAELVKAIGIFTSTLPDDVRESCAAAGKTESQKSVNYLARQLKALICIHYGADVADKLKKYLDDPDSEIRKDFASKGLKAPGGKALQRHLENVDVETLDDDK
ncbi:hypothetical protein PXU46_002455 [Salmonella enterica]|nr:hypothetical protein [Salmonella enterica]ECX4882123.1 hypothetical protein [Salmonella enterica]EKN5826004.1 hypothetical protein [Salmonella enterica]HCM1845992.1 hypothetical protein [Salmonella enterica subsp. diarizonae serovar 16:z10:e,n,x,z15]